MKVLFLYTKDDRYEIPLDGQQSFILRFPDATRAEIAEMSNEQYDALPVAEDHAKRFGE